MSAAMSPDEIVAAFKRWHVKVVEVKRGGDSWRSHHRPGDWGNVNGQIAHHTGPYSSVSGIVSLLWNGRSDLPGPLCHTGIAPDGTVYLVSAGRSNHAGKGSARVLSYLIEDRPPPSPGPDAVDGNARLYGDEVMNPGDGTPYPAAQVEALVRVHAARAQHHGWTGASTIRHGGWTRRKVDTSVMSQSFLEEEVDRALRLGPDRYSYPAGKDDDDMPLTDDDAQKIVSALLGQKLGRSGPTVGVALQRMAQLAETLDKESS